MAIRRHSIRSPSTGRKKRPKQRPRRASARDLNWEATTISEQEWETYRAAFDALRSADVPFMLGGGFAQGTFTGRWRNTKDIDLYILPEHREKSITALSAGGFLDYYERLPYDRKWIYRSYRSDSIVDIIWSMANQRAQVDSLWFDRAATVLIHDEPLSVIPIEELLWCKAYVLQRDRCDWVDIFNLLHFNAFDIDWAHLMRRLEDDLPLLQAILTVFCWLHPKSTAAIPRSLRDCLNLPIPPPKPLVRSRRTWRDRVRLLDSRGWFAALSEKLEV